MSMEENVTNDYLQVVAQASDPPNVLADVAQLWYNSSDEFHIKFHKDGDPGENISHKLLDYDGNLFADGYLFADKAIAGGIVAVSDGTIALDLTAGSCFTCTTSQNTSWSTSAPTDGVGGERCSFVVDNSGGFTVAWAAGFTNVDAIGAADTGIHVRTLQFNGTTWHQIASTEDGAATNGTPGPAGPAGGAFRTVALRSLMGPISAGASIGVLNDGNFFGGYEAGKDYHTGDFNTFLGTYAAHTALRGDANIAIGPYSLSSLDGTGSDANHNVAIGYQAGKDITTGHANLLMGYQSGNAITTGDDNIGIGENALDNETVGWSNVAIGANSLALSTGADMNVALGESSLYNAGVAAITGQKNVAIGYKAGEFLSASSNRNVVIGPNVGPTAEVVEDDKLYIDNHQTNTPLIEGDFSGHTIDINGTLSKTAGSFKIEHPLDDSKYLYHGFVEAPEYGLIYRGKIKLDNGKATVYIDEACGMTPGVFEALVQNTTIYLQNLTGFSAVRPTEITGDSFEIMAQDIGSNDEISWMVCGERKDDFVMKANQTDSNGHLILEIDKK